MGQTTVCGAAPQQCVDECARLQLDLRIQDADDPECDPAGAIFSDTLEGLVGLDKEALRFAGQSNLSAVRWLLSMGASAKARDRNGTTMLHAACRSGSCLIVQELVKQGVQMDAQDSSGWTSLHIVAVMGRRDLALLLLRVRASASVRNKKGETPLALCSDPGTKEVLEEFSTESRVARPHPKPFLADMLVANPGGNNDDYSATCEPFFVPRLPLCHNEAHRAEVLHIGIDLFRQSAGHGLAFFVATGVVHDHPTDMSDFLMANKVDPVQLGEFLGEDFSLAQTLRLAFVHSVDVAHTGVVGALLKAFRYFRAPVDLGKVDRLTGAVAHLWWRTHDDGDWDGFVGAPDTEDLDWTMFSEDLGGSADDAPKLSAEASGSRLRQALRSVEGLRRLMFSTMMLCWNLHNKWGLFAGAVSPRRMSLPAWLDMNVGIEADGSNIPVHAQKGIYHAVSELRGLHVLLPVDKSSPQPGPDRAGMSPASTAIAVQDASLLVKGWATIPRGGLERHNPSLAALGLAQGGNRLAGCVLSEATSSQAQLPPDFLAGQPQPAAAVADDGEIVWLSLRLSLFLFFSTSPSDAAPYAFLRLQDVVLGDVNRQTRLLVLVGRPSSEPRPTDKLTSAPKPRTPSLDLGRAPLPLCFLLADGRFQPFEAMRLELRFSLDEELELWAQELGVACSCQGPVSVGEQGPATSRNVTSLDGPVADSERPSTSLGARQPTTPPAELSETLEDAEGDPAPAG